MQQQVFDVIGLSQDEAKSQFGFLLDAFKYGPPPHGGMAFGWDRVVMLLAGVDTIRDVIAFPKAASGADPLTGAPTVDHPRPAPRSRHRRQARPAQARLTPGARPRVVGAIGCFYGGLWRHRPGWGGGVGAIDPGGVRALCSWRERVKRARAGRGRESGAERCRA